MKKIISLTVLLALVVLMFTACSFEEQKYTLSIGVKTTISDTGAKVSETVAAIVTDEDGKIALCRIDAIDYEPKLGSDGKVVSSKPMTKRDKGTDYGMSAYADKGEWFEQVDFFEEYATGKTVAEISSLALSGGKATDADLVAGCTIAVTDIIDAIKNAAESEHKSEFKAWGKLKGSVAAIGSNEGTSDELSFGYSTDFAAVVSVRGRVVSALIDSLQVQISCEAENGKLKVISSVNKGTKLEQGESYGMGAYAACGEWYMQAIAYAESALGYEAKKLDILPTENVAGCSMYSGGYKEALSKAGKSVK